MGEIFPRKPHNCCPAKNYGIYLPLSVQAYRREFSFFPPRSFLPFARFFYFLSCIDMDLTRYPFHYATQEVGLLNEERVRWSTLIGRRELKARELNSVAQNQRPCSFQALRSECHIVDRRRTGSLEHAVENLAKDEFFPRHPPFFALLPPFFTASFGFLVKHDCRKLQYVKLGTFVHASTDQGYPLCLTSFTTKFYLERMKKMDIFLGIKR